MENAIEGIFQTTLDGECTMVNAAWVDLPGYASPEEYISQTANIENPYVDPSRRTELIRLLQTDGYLSETVQ